ncbi:MAG: hypothetical protein ACFFG0_04110 [Candidatus Thorarchaeota archaeon]
MKQSVVKYKKLNKGRVMLIAFENVASAHKLSKVFGDEVEQVYNENPPNYSRIDRNTIEVNGELFKTEVVLEQKEFQDLISTMKSAGKRLMEIRKEIDNKIHEIKI